MGAFVIDSQQGSWYWPPVFRNAQELVSYYDTIEVPDKAMNRFDKAYGHRAVGEGKTGAATRIPPHLMQTVIRAAMMRAIGSTFPLSEQKLVDKHELPWAGGDERTVKWIALHFQTDDLGFDALYGALD